MIIEIKVMKEEVNHHLFAIKVQKITILKMII